MIRERVADEGLRRALVAMVRGRVPPHEVDEIVQETLADAFASKSVPTEAEDLDRWVRGIARHKVADYHRRARREVAVEPDSLASARVTDQSAHEAADLLRWAERETNDRTLDWLLREGDGEKLQTIAREEQVPAARVRQRVTRLRRHFRARWAAQLAALLAITVMAFLLLRGRRPHPAPIAPVGSASPAPPPPVSASTPPASSPSPSASAAPSPSPFLIGNGGAKKSKPSAPPVKKPPSKVDSAMGF